MLKETTRRPRLRTVECKTHLPRHAGLMLAHSTWISSSTFELDRPIAGLDREKKGHPVLDGLGVMPAAVVEELLENVLQTICSYGADVVSAAF